MTGGPRPFRPLVKIISGETGARTRKKKKKKKKLILDCCREGAVEALRALGFQNWAP